MTTAMHWSSRYIGLPWESGADGPDAYNCWNFVRMIQRVHYGRDVPPIPVDEADMLACVRAFDRHPERRRWPLVQHPAEGDMVLLTQHSRPSHIGVWLDANRGGALHCQIPDGVVFHTRLQLADQGWAIEGAYRFGGDNG
ncbi:MAG: NlpC/P60 family protein [Pseudomonadota bacterium]